jgi:tetratricopeptide (TPR) repeat protein
MHMTRARTPTRKPGDRNDRGGAGRVAGPWIGNGALLVILVAVVAAAVLIVHWPALSSQALSFDDQQYLTENYLVQKPSWASAGRFFREVLTPSTVAGYYQPLAMISLMLDYAQGGRPDNLRPFHRTSLALHVVNTSLVIVLLYMLLSAPLETEGVRGGGDGRTTAPRSDHPPKPPLIKGGSSDARRSSYGPVWAAAMVGLLFGIHPLTVEPIPWVGERKTLLAAFFTLLCLISYVAYARRGSRALYAGCLAAYILALLSKPTSTPLPVLLLLLDFYPLQRIGFSLGHGRGPRKRARPAASDAPLGLAQSAPADNSSRDSRVRRALLEKLPFFIIGGVSAIITVISQARTAAVEMPTEHPAIRIPLILCHNIIFYLYKVVCPINLTSHYPFPKPLALSDPMILAGVIGTCILIPALLLSLRWTRAPLTGWLFFLAAIFPTMGIIGFTNVIASDKYAYLPSVGLLMVLAWLCLRAWNAGLREPWSGRAWAGLLLLVAVTAVAEGVATRRYLACWQTTEGLYDHMIRLAPGAPSLHTGLGYFMASQGRYRDAILEFQEALRLKHDQADAMANLGTALLELGQTREATGYLLDALRINPKLFAVQNNLAQALAAQGKYDEAIEHLNAALRIRPDSPRAHYNLANALIKRGRTTEAIRHFETALEIRPEYPEAHGKLADALAAAGRSDEAIGHYRQALRLRPDYADTHNNLAAELIACGRMGEALQHVNEALRLRPDFAKAQFNLGMILFQRHEPDEALAQLREAVRLDPDLADAHNSLAVILLQKGRLDEAAAELRETLRLQPDSPRSHYNLGYVLERQGRRDEAVEHYRRALQLDPHHANARERLDALLAAPGPPTSR